MKIEFDMRRNSSLKKSGFFIGMENIDKSIVLRGSMYNTDGHSQSRVKCTTGEAILERLMTIVSPSCNRRNCCKFYHTQKKKKSLNPLGSCQPHSNRIYVQ